VPVAPPPKLSLPDRKRADIPRPRLTKALAPILEKRVSIVAAPAGFGKTLAVSEVVARSGGPAVWIALDPTDDDLATLLGEIAAGLAVQGAGAFDLARRLVESEGSRKGGERAGLLLASEISLAFGPEGVVIVLDDAHLLGSPAVWEAIAGLVRGVVPLHLVLVAQSAPPLALGRLRASDDLFVAARDLFPFDVDEIRRAAQARLGTSLPDPDLAELHGRTAGWPALVRIALAALAEGRGLSTSELGRFLREEVHGRVSPLARAVFDEIAWLGEPRESLVAALHHPVEAGADFEAAVGELERVGLVARHEGGVLRANPGAASLAVDRARALEAPALHARAADAAQKLGDLDAAISHRRAAGDIRAAATTILEEAPRRFAAGAAETVLRWTEGLPDDVIRAFPEIAYVRAVALRRRGAAASAAVELARAERCARAAGDARVLARALSALATLRVESGELEEARALAREATEVAPADDPATQAHALFAEARAEYHGGSAELGVELGERAFDLAVRAGDATLAVRIAVGMGVPVLRMRGWDVASALIDDAREIASGAGLAFDLLAMDSPIEERLLLDAGDLEACLAAAGRRRELLDRVGDEEGAALANLEAGQALCMLGRAQEALDVVARSEQVLGRSGGPVVHELLWLRAESLAAAGRFGEADEALALGLGRSDAAGARVARPFYLGLRASIAIRGGDPARVSQWLDEATPLFEGGGIRALGRAWLPMLRAELALAKGDEAEAARHLDLALVESRRTGAMAILFDGPKQAGKLLALAEARGLHPDYLAETRRRLPVVRAERSRQATTSRTSPCIRVQLLGSLLLFRPGESSPARWHSLKGRDLLAFLLLSRRRAVGRADLVEAIWPEAELERGRPLLRFHLFHLRRTLSDDVAEGKSLVWSAGDECGIRPGAIVTDLEEMEAGFTEARSLSGRDALAALERAVARWGGPLCQSLEYPWMTAPRERVRREYRAALDRIAQLQLDLGSPMEAEATLRLVLSDDRTDESTARRLLSLLLDRGDRSGALGVYRAIDKALREEMGVGPDEETQKVARPILRR